MRSKWIELKAKAIKLRRHGLSIKKVEKKLGVPRSTLSGWFKNVELSPQHKEQLHNDWKNALVKARQKAIEWHTSEKKKRLLTAEKEAFDVLSKINTGHSEIIDLALAILYLGEGFKTTVGIGIGNSDPLLLRFFISALKKNYNFPISAIKCELHLRADQNPALIKRYWSKELEIPLTNFTTITFDKRTVGSPTYATYKGVCALRCGHAAIQRKLLYLSKMFLQKVIDELGS